MDTRSADVASADLSPRPDRSAWATARAQIERGAYSVGPAGRRPRWRNKAFGAALYVFDWGAWLAGLRGRGRANALAPHLVELDLFFPDLPAAFDSYRILQLSDTHLDLLPELAIVGREMLAGLEVDLLALTGDILGLHGAVLASAIRPLEHLLKGLVVRDRRLAVLGNHDPAAMAEALEAIGFEVLLNQSTALVRHGERIVVTGLDDVHHFYTEAARAALYDGGGTDFRIALIHSPEMADYAAEAGIALYLCGHTHGGQVCLPGGRPLVTRLTRCGHAASGLWSHGSMQGYTSRGLGTSWPPLRYNCRAEMTVITLRRG
jgi:predicted MPP superfamily phosphohydrolase